jgi:hypothetical protein
MISAVIGAISGAMRCWNLGAWSCFGGLVFGFLSGFGTAMMCSFPYVVLLSHLQKNASHLERIAEKLLYIPQTILGMVLAWFVPSWVF